MISRDVIFNKQINELFPEAEDVVTKQNSSQYPVNTSSTFHAEKPTEPVPEKGTSSEVSQTSQPVNPN